MSILKRTWLFWFVVFFLPLLTIVVAGVCGNEIGVHLINNESHLYVQGGFIHTLFVSVSTSLIAAGIVYLFIDKRLKDLIEIHDEITIVLKSPIGKSIACPPMSRRDLTRSEVMGYIGMTVGKSNFNMTPKRFDELASKIRETQKSKGNQKLIVKITEEEMEQLEERDK